MTDKLKQAGRALRALSGRLPLRALVLAGGLPLMAFFFVTSSRGEEATIPEVAAPPVVQQAPARPVILADGESYEVSTPAATVAEALRAAGIVLNGLDRVEPGLSQVIPIDGAIRVTRVEVATEYQLVTEPRQRHIIVETSLRPDVILQAIPGQDGQLRRQLRVWKKDGVVTRRAVVGTTRLQKRVNTLEIRGRGGSLPSRGGQVRRCLTMVATAYDPGPISCGKYADGYTSIGLKAGKGIVAVDPRVIPMRSRLYIPGYGLALAGDVGGAIKGNRIDLGFDTYAEAIRYGRRTVKVFILD